MKRILSVTLCACLLLALLPIMLPPALMINNVSVSADHTAAFVGDILTWTAYDMDGAGNYQYHFEIDWNNWPVLLDDWDNWRLMPSASWQAAEPGTYKASVMVYDLGWDDYAEAASADTIVTLRSASVIYAESVGPNSLLVAWEIIPGVSGYELLRSTSQAGPYTSLGYFNDNRHTDTTVTKDVLYWYKVQSYNEVNGIKCVSSELSGAASAMPMAIPPKPEVKTLSNSSLSIVWDEMPGAAGYELWQGTSLNGAFTNIHSGHVVNYVDTGLITGTVYYYKVLAYKKINNAIYDGPFSLPVMGVPMDVALDAPVITSLTWHTQPDLANNLHLMVDLVWTPVSGVVGYEAFSRVGDAGEYYQDTETSENDVTNGFFLPTEPTRYWFKVRGYTGQLIPEVGENAYLVGPFSPEAYIDIPALTADTGITISPYFTAKIPALITPTPKPMSTIRRTTLKLVTPTPEPTILQRVTLQLITPSPEPTLRLVTRKPATPAPTVWRQIIELPVITPTPAPTVQQIIPLDPVIVIPLAPIRRVNP